MNDRLPSLVNTCRRPGTKAHPGTSCFDGSIGLKPAANHSALRKTFTPVFLLLVLCLRAGALGGQTQDAEYETVAEEYVKTYLTAHPLEGTALGLHEYRWQN